MPSTALSKGLHALGSWLPIASLEKSIAWGTSCHQLSPTPAGLVTLKGATPRRQHAGVQPGQLQLLPHHRWAWPHAQPTIRSHPLCCSHTVDGAGGGTDGEGGGPSPDSPTETRWRLEEGDAAAHYALNVVLVSPQIPGNTGTIARTCAAAGVRLHLVKPMAFQLDDAKLKRAGLDYWPYVCVAVHDSWAAFMDYYQTQAGPKRLIGFSKKAQTLYTDVRYCESDWLLFGSETHGFPEATVTSIKEEGALVRIPMSERHVRSLNLAVSVGIGLFESLRQLEAHNTLVQNECQEMLHVTPGLAADERATSPMGT